MKPIVIVAGNYVEGTQGGIIIENWQIDSTSADESFTPDDLKQIAISNNTYKIEEGIITSASAGIRWYGDDPFEI